MAVFLDAPGRTRFLACTAVLVGAAGAPPARADEPMPTLRCELRYMSASLTIHAQPTRRPYEVRPTEVEGRFAFKAVVVGDAQRVDYVALYAYDLVVRHAPVLLHEVVYPSPVADDRPVPGLTGWNHVYSSELGREFVYGCALQSAGRP